MRFAAGLAALALVAGAALAEPDIKPWKGKATLALARNDIQRAMEALNIFGRLRPDCYLHWRCHLTAASSRLSAW